MRITITTTITTDKLKPIDREQIGKKADRAADKLKGDSDGKR